MPNEEIDQGYDDGLESDQAYSSIIQWRLLVGALVGMYFYVALFHDQLMEKIKDIQQIQQQGKAYQKHLDEVEKREAREEQMLAFMSAEDLDKYNKDVELVNAMNIDNIQRIKDRASEAREFKSSLLTYPEDIDYSTIFFLIELYSQGVSDKDYQMAREFFRIKNDELAPTTNTMELNQEIMKTMLNTFAPEGSYNRLRTSAVESLACNLCQDSQNCHVPARLMAMALMRNYPELSPKDLYFQRFENHIRLLAEINGERYVVEGNIDTFPDKETGERRSQVIPLDAWVQIYAGASLSDFEDRIEYHGPPAGLNGVGFKVTNNNLVNEVPMPIDLDSIDTAKQYYRMGQNADVNQNDSSKPEANRRLNEELPDTHIYMNYHDDQITKESLEEKWKSRNRSSKVGIIDFLNLSELDVEQARILVDFASSDGVNITSVYFRSLRQPVSREVIDLLGTFEFIIFEQMEWLSVEMAEGINRIETQIVFDRIEMLTEEATRGMVGKPQKPTFRRIPSEPQPIELVWMHSDEYDLPAMKNIDGEVKVSPTNNKQVINFKGLKYMSVEAASIFTQIDRELHFGEVELSEEVGRTLASGTTPIELNGVNLEFLRGIRDYAGYMTIFVHEFTPDDAEILSGKEKGKVKLMGFFKLPIETQLKLIKINTELEIDYYYKDGGIVPEVAEALEKRSHPTTISASFFNPEPKDISALTSLKVSLFLSMNIFPHELESLLLHRPYPTVVELSEESDSRIQELLLKSRGENLKIVRHQKSP